MNNKITFNNLCRDCGFVSNHLTMLKRHGAKSIQPSFKVSTVSEGICDICEKEKTVVPVRDFRYPSERAMKYVKNYILKGKL